MRDAVIELNEGARWGRMDVASGYVSPPFRPQFQASHVRWGRDIQIADTEIIGMNPETDEEGGLRFLEEQLSLPFDLSRDLLIRAGLARKGRDEYLLILIIHHIAIDAWSLDVLLRELKTLYAATPPERIPLCPSFLSSTPTTQCGNCRVITTAISATGRGSLPDH